MIDEKMLKVACHFFVQSRNEILQLYLDEKIKHPEKHPTEWGFKVLLLGAIDITLKAVQDEKMMLALMDRIEDLKDADTDVMHLFGMN